MNVFFPLSFLLQGMKNSEFEPDDFTFIMVKALLLY